MRQGYAQPMARLSPDTVLNFSGERADLAWRLSRALPADPQTRNSIPCFASRDAIDAGIADIERAGILIDGPALAARSRQIEQEPPVTPRASTSWPARNSTSTRRRSLVGFCSKSWICRSAKRTGRTRSFSTAAEVLEELALTHELPRLVLECRALQLKSTCRDALPVMVDSKTGRVHTSCRRSPWNRTIERLDPNLQNIRSEPSWAARFDARSWPRARTCADLRRLLTIELRVLAHMAGEQALIDAFRAGEDIHERTGQKLFGVNNAMDKHQLRSLSKMVNYAVLYGKTPFTLAKDINVTQEAAQEFITA